jgi:hypothetical protein
MSETLTREAVLEAWAPPDSRWSAWVKPILFAQMESPQPAAKRAALAAPWAPPPSEAVALILDLPGEWSVEAGLAAAAAGYQPVPLYNALAFPATPMKPQSRAFVDVWPIMTALINGAPELARRTPDQHAPPAFLVDANRSHMGIGGRQHFDNRSVCLPGDFPSAAALQRAGIERILVVQWRTVTPQDDVTRTLEAWQTAGLRIDALSLDSSSLAHATDGSWRTYEEQVRPCPVVPATRWGRLVRRSRLALLARFRPNSSGAFGHVVQSAG